MLRAKAQRFKTEGASLRDRTLTSPDRLLSTTSIPLVDITVNALNKTGAFRKALSAGMDIHHEAPLPKLHSKTLRKRVKPLLVPQEPQKVGNTTGKIALYATCYGNYNSPDVGEDFVKVFQHNGIHIDIVPKEKCCGMPKLSTVVGDLCGSRRGCASSGSADFCAISHDSGREILRPAEKVSKFSVRNPP